MKNLLLLIIVISIFSSCSQKKEESLSADEIWHRYIKTFGDSAILYNTKTIEIYGQSQTSYGLMKIVMKAKFPDKGFYTMTAPDNMFVTYIVNGDSGIIKSPTGTVGMSEEDFLLWKKTGLIYSELYEDSLELVGIETINGRPCYNIEVTTEAEVLHYFIDTANFHVVRIDSKLNTLEIIDIVHIDGLNLVKTNRMIQGKDTFLMEFTSYNINPVIPDSIFDLD